MVRDCTSNTVFVLATMTMFSAKRTPAIGACESVGIRLIMCPLISTFGNLQSWRVSCQVDQIWDMVMLRLCQELHVAEEVHAHCIHRHFPEDLQVKTTSGIADGEHLGNLGERVRCSACVESDHR